MLAEFYYYRQSRTHKPKGSDSLTIIKNDLLIGGNPHIKNLEGLENLHTIGKNLLIGIYPDYDVIEGNDSAAQPRRD